MSEVKEDAPRRSLDEMTKEILEAEYTKCRNKVLQKALNTLRRFDTRYYLEECIVSTTVTKRVLGVFPIAGEEQRTEYRILRRSADGTVMCIKLRSVEDSTMRDILTAEEVNAWVQGKIFDLKPAAKREKEMRK